jgi:hypothetical protein
MIVYLCGAFVIGSVLDARATMLTTCVRDVRTVQTAHGEVQPVVQAKEVANAPAHAHQCASELGEESVETCGSCAAGRSTASALPLAVRSDDPVSADACTLQLSIERLARRMCFFMSVTLPCVLAWYAGGELHSVPLYYLGATAAWISANGGGIVSIVLYSRQAHTVELKRSASEWEAEPRRSDCSVCSVSSQRTQPSASERSPVRRSRRSPQPASPVVNDALRWNDVVKLGAEVCGPGQGLGRTSIVVAADI